MYVYIYIYMYICIYVYVYVHVYSYMCISVPEAPKPIRPDEALMLVLWIEPNAFASIFHRLTYESLATVKL